MAFIFNTVTSSSSNFQIANPLPSVQSSSSSASLEKRASEVVQQQLTEKKGKCSFDSDSDEELQAQRAKAKATAPNIEHTILGGTMLCMELNTLLGRINFYPNYEDQEVRTIPVEEFAQFAKRLLAIQIVYNQVRGFPPGQSFINEEVKPFFEKFRKVLESNAIRSREAQLKKLQENPDETNEDWIEGVARVQEHLARLGKPDRRHYLEMLMQMLNLKEMPERNRKPTQNEQQAFRFLSEMLGLRYR